MFTFLNQKSLISLQGSKINDGLCNKSNSGFSFKLLTRNKQTNIVVNAETIGLQKYSVRLALKLILPRIDKKNLEIEIRLVPVLTHFTDENMDTRLKQVSIKHSHVYSNIKTYEIDSFKTIDNAMNPSSEIALWKLIMEIGSKDGERFPVTMTRNWKNVMERWVKNKCKKICKCSSKLLSKVVM